MVEFFMILLKVLLGIILLETVVCGFIFVILLKGI